ncbi:hypothetical protein BGZ51_009105 [Haplosporangium sp. Z 767]|nr:hypothetical protein BGZ51_009105 [Haplosporangium sp. Z 767]
MNLDLDHLSIPSGLKASSIPIHPLLTPPLDDSLSAAASLVNNTLNSSTDPITQSQPQPDDSLSHKLADTAFASIASPDFPVRVELLPNKGRSYIATRTIQPQELVFVAEAFGTTMCDPWLDCGVCHYCWMNIQNRKAQVRLPRREDDSCGNNKGRKRAEAVMVFCDETCLNLYGPQVADMICRVEHKIRRTWSDAGARYWKLRLPALAKTDDMEINSMTKATTYCSQWIEQALATADTSHSILRLNDQDLASFLNCVWNALDSLIAYQESLVLDGHDTKRPYTQEQYESLYPKLAKYILEGNNDASIAPQTSDDDCETIRLISEVLYRRQLEMIQGVADNSLNSTFTETPIAGTETGTILGQFATFADYRAMQSNELVVVRQQIQEEMDDQDQDQIQVQVQDLDSQDTNSKRDPNRKQWRRLLSILPSQLLNSFYVYLRMRDAYLLLTLENTPCPSGSVSLRSLHQSLDNTIFRTILYREVANSFGIRDSTEELLGFAVFPRASFFNHSCRPNIEKRRRQGNKARQMEYWSTRVIESGEECCISYGDISKGREERQQRLEDMYFFKCSCPRCQEEEEEEGK